MSLKIGFQSLFDMNLAVNTDGQNVVFAGGFYDAV
jgi:hypothetical protein